MSKYSFEVDKICNYLQPLKEKLPDLYKWDANIDMLEELLVFTQQEINDISCLSPFDKELKIKESVNIRLNKLNELKDKKSFYNLCLWIIKEWGGINRANDTSTIGLIENFLISDKHSFTGIASTSKVGSFLNPMENVIYDSRVAYSLNWIILSETSSNYFFPIPKGRNSRMVAFDMDVLIRLKFIDYYQTTTENELDNRKFINNRDKQLYIPKNEAYFELNHLIKQINNKLWKGDNMKMKYLYYTEMLLFSIADKQIYNDITKRVRSII